MDQSDAGKKIFILYPHSVIKEELMDLLIMAGFESYTLRDHKRALKLLEKFPDSIIFINIDDGMGEKEWEVYIKGIMENPKTKDCRVGILSYNTDKALMQKYLMEIAVPCGYIQLKLGVRESTKIMIYALEANEARGKRKYIRAFCADDINATVNVKGSGGIYYGKILDISAAGIAAKFDKFDDLPPNTKIREMQLKLRGGLILTDAVLIGRRNDNVCIFLFDVPRMSPDHALIIHRFIKYTIQHYMDNLVIR
ncbi:MAG: PilZ domain-containing protein [Treponema sp.]|nr:PilZ domain-containing protein [Treponema sp.]